MTVSAILRKLGPLIPDDVSNWRRSLPLLDTETRVLLEKHIITTGQRLLGDWENKVLLPPPPAVKTRGPLRLGDITYDEAKHPFGLAPGELLQGLSIFGRSGAGKTNVVFGLLLQLDKLGIPFLFLDWKRTCRHLLPRLKSSVNFYTPGRDLSPLAFNPLIPPPGIEQRSYITQIVDLLGSAYTLGDGARSLLQKVLHKAYQDAAEWPTLDGVLALLESEEVTGRASGWKTTATRALQSLTLVDRLAHTDTSQEALVARLLESCTVIELDGLNEGAKKFLVPALMLWLFGYRLQARDREQLRLVIIVEEAHHLLFRQESRTQESVMNQLLRQCRELGIGIVVVDQHPHLISSAALGNAYTSICLNLKEPSDINRSAVLSQLKEDEKQYLSMLPIGHGIVKLQDKCPYPFLVQFPHVDVDKGHVTDEVLRRHLRRGRTRSRWNTSQTASRARDRRFRVADSAVSQDGIRLLLDCANQPTDGVRARYLRLGFSVDKGNRLKNDLLRAGMIAAAEVPLGRTRRIILRPTKQTRLLLRLDGSPTNESVEHEFWKHHYAAKFRDAGYQVELESPRRGGRVDVCAQKGNERVAVEIETGKSDAVKNVSNCLRSRFDLVVVVATSEDARVKVECELVRKGLLVRGRVVVVLRDGFGV